MPAILIKIQNFHSKICIWKNRLWNGGHCVQGRWISHKEQRRCQMFRVNKLQIFMVAALYNIINAMVVILYS